MEEVGRRQGGFSALPSANLFSVIDKFIARAMPEAISND
jgi:hypothetical protein